METETKILLASVGIVIIIVLCYTIYKLWIAPREKEQKKRRNDLHSDAFFLPPTDSSHHIHMDGEQFEGFGNGGEFGGGGASGDWNPDVSEVVESSQGLLEGAGEAIGNAAESAGEVIGEVLGGIGDGL